MVSESPTAHSANAPNKTEPAGNFILTGKAPSVVGFGAPLRAERAAPNWYIRQKKRRSSPAPSPISSSAAPAAVMTMPASGPFHDHSVQYDTVLSERYRSATTI